MLQVGRKIYKSLIILLLLAGFYGCGKEKLVLSLDQDAFNNQNASALENQALSSKDLLSEATDIAPPKASELPTMIPDKELEEDTPQSFQAVEETVYATSNVKIRSNYTTRENNVIDILVMGESIQRIGIGKEWSKVVYHNTTGYINSAYLTTKLPEQTPTPVLTTTPTPAPTPMPTPTPLPKGENEITPKTTITPTPATDPKVSTEEADQETFSGDYSFVETLTLSETTEKLVCVIGTTNSDCTVSYHKKNQKGEWAQMFSVDGDCGSKGITYQKREGDDMTPAGLYSFTLAFGLKSDPGAYLNYRRITEDDYWIDDINSPYYNTWVNATDTPGEYTSEHLIDHNPSYNYVLNINYNADCTPGLGSAIFLHCYNGTGYTNGCISISEKHMKTLLKEVDSETRILIVPKEKDLSNY